MADLIKLVRILLRSSEGTGFSKALIFFSMITGVIAGIANAGFIAVINTALSASPASRSRLIWIFAALCIVLPASRFLSAVLLSRIVQRARAEMELRLCRRILAAPLRQIEEIGPPRLFAALTDDVGTIAVAFGNIPVLLRLIAVVVGCLIYLGWLSWWLLLLVIASLAVATFTYQVPTTLGRHRFRKSRELSDVLFQHFRGLTEGIKELKIHGRRRRAFTVQHLEPTARSRAQNRIGAQTVFAVAESWTQLTTFLILGLLLFALPAVRDVGFAALTGYVIGFLYILNPIEAILSRFPDMSQAVIAVQQLERLDLRLDEKDGVVKSEPAEGEPRWSRLTLAAVTHQYYNERDERNFTLGPVDLTFTPGETIFLVGGNGSGKTTLAKLIIGLYLPESGAIRLDDEPIDDSNREKLRSLFSVVFSDFFLFDSLLGLDRPLLTAETQRYLADLQLESKVKVDGGALSTIKLSQGQRKRLALLVAYLEDRPIYLFDEWAADQDPQFKEVFYLQLLPSLKARGKTIIVISHDDRYYGMAERMIKLDSGNVISDWQAPEPLELRVGSASGA
jgi:putative pyoverdin transport system ATP-binding/permease protein